MRETRAAAATKNIPAIVMERQKTTQGVVVVVDRIPVSEWRASLKSNCLHGLILASLLLPQLRSRCKFRTTL